MKLRLSFLAAPAAAVVLSLLAGCGESSDPPANTGGSSSGGTGPASGGSAGSAGSAGLKSTGGVSGGGSGGVSTGGSLNTAGTTSGGSGGVSSGGVSGGGSGGLKSTGGVSGGGSGGVSTGGVSGGGSSSGGASGGAMPMIPGPNLDTVKFVITQVTCFGGSCHDLHENPLNLRIDQMNPDLHTRLMTHTTKNCGKLVDTANPANSALVKILKGPCGATPRMPSDGCLDDTDPKCVPADYIAAIQQWIAMGAPK